MTTFIRIATEPVPARTASLEVTARTATQIAQRRARIRRARARRVLAESGFVLLCIVALYLAPIVLR